MNPTQTFHPTPVFSAIRNIRFTVPRNRTRVLSKESFIVSAREEEERISSPIEMVSCIALLVVNQGREERGRANIFQHLDLGGDAFYFAVVLVFQLGQNGVAVLTSVLLQRVGSASAINTVPSTLRLHGHVLAAPCDPVHCCPF